MSTNLRPRTYYLAAVTFLTLSAAAQTATITTQEKEAFLKKAKVVSKKDVSKGVTGTSRVTLSDGVITHDASFQTIDDHQAIFQAAGGKTELNFKDTYKFNIAAWKLANMIGLSFMVPPSVERTIGNSGALTWWIDDVQMDEGERTKKNLSAPDQLTWLRETALMKMFDQLIHNNDRNVGNMVIDKNWHLWMIDHTRAFRTAKTLPNPGNLTLVERGVLAKMKALDEKSMTAELGKLLIKDEIRAVLARRDLIVSAIEAKGPNVLFDLPSAK
jgi:hypothetical protein